jgi:D-amino-acid dehydrogenase
MRVAVLGAGLMGVATAYYLWRDGHEVDVYDARDDAACETSYANACLISASRALPWPTPTAHKTVWRALIDTGAPMRIIKPLDPRLWRWGGEFLSYVNAASYEVLTRAKLAFAKFCQHELQETIADISLDCGYRQDGLLYVFRSESARVAAQTRAELVAKHGFDVHILSRDEAITLEPALAQSDIIGASYAVSDAQGDSRIFTRELAKYLQKRGVRFHFNIDINTSLSVVDRGYSVFGNGEELHADKFVVALGPRSFHFAKQLGLKLPLYPVKGYSLTVPIKDRSLAPMRGGLCEDTLVAYCPLGDSMRLTTGAHFAGDDTSFADQDFEKHRESFESLFPGALDWGDESKIERWACLRPMTPSSLPILTTTIDHFGDGTLIWNCGQGHIGWTMCCGSAKIATDLVAERSPSHSLNGMQKT